MGGAQEGGFYKRSRIRIERERRTTYLLGRLPIGITSGTGSHESRTRGTALSHAQPPKHCPNTLPALRAQ
jgi:hypothetical protein